MGEHSWVCPKCDTKIGSRTGHCPCGYRVGKYVSELEEERDEAVRRLSDAEELAWETLGKPEGTHATTNVDRLCDASRKLQAKAAALISKIEECKPHVDGAFFMAFQRRGQDYKGPNWSEELKALREALGIKEAIDGSE